MHLSFGDPGIRDKPWKLGEMWVDEMYQVFTVTTVQTIFDHEACM